MKYFSKTVAIVSFAISGIKALGQMAKAAPLSTDAETEAEWAMAALSFAKVAASVGNFCVKGAKMAEVFGMEGRAAEKFVQGSKMCEQGMRAMAAYSADVASGRGMSEITRLLGLSVESQWQEHKQWMLEDAKSEDGKMLVKLAAAMGAIALAVVPCAIRAEAKSLAESGNLSKEKTEEMAARTRAVIADGELMSKRVEDMVDKPGSEEKAVGKKLAARTATRLARARSKANSSIEESQVYWIGGMLKEAQDCVVAGQFSVAQDERDEARARLVKEVSTERGNDKGFCEWARAAFDIGAKEVAGVGKPKVKMG